LFTGRLELVGYCLQANDEVCLIILSEGSPLQVEGDFSASGDGAEEKLAELLSQILGNVIDISEPALSEGAS
jgi:hypothetical protein